MLADVSGWPWVDLADARRAQYEEELRWNWLMTRGKCRAGPDFHRKLEARTPACTRLRAR
jgi:hypothetical protein